MTTRILPGVLALCFAIVLIFIPVFFNPSIQERAVEAAPITQDEMPSGPTPPPIPDTEPTPTPLAEVAVDLTSDAVVVTPTYPLSYTVVVTNTTDEIVSQLLVSATIPQSTTYVTESNNVLNYDPTTGAVVWAVGDVLPHTIVSQTFEVATSGTNEASIILGEVEASSEDLTNLLASWEVNALGEIVPNEMWLTPEGGSLTSESETVTIIAPTDALTEALYLEIGETSALTLPPHIWNSFDLTSTNKSGQVVTTFPVSITISVDVSSYITSASNISGTPSLYWLNDSSHQWELMPSNMDWKAGVVSAQTGHFSTFGVGLSQTGSYGVQHLPAMHGAGSDEFSGNSSYTYPFRLPPGPSGFDLNLGLGYSSEGVNSLLARREINDMYTYLNTYYRQAGSVGWGWTLTGLGAVTRDIQENRFYLSFGHGSYELIRTAGPDANGAFTWHTKPESFLKIMQYSCTSCSGGNDLDRANSWLVWTSDGTKYTFGDRSFTNKSVAYSIDIGGCHREIREAHLREVLDTHGNKIVVDYENEPRAFQSSECSTSQNYIRAIRPTVIHYYPIDPSPLVEEEYDSVRITLAYTDTREDEGVINFDNLATQVYFSDVRLWYVLPQIRNGVGTDPADPTPFSTTAKYVLGVDYKTSSGWGTNQKIMVLANIAERGSAGGSVLPLISFVYSVPSGASGANFHLLQKADNGQGGSVNFTYQQVTAIPIHELPNNGCSGSSSLDLGAYTTRRWRVRTMTVWDGILGNTVHEYVALNSQLQDDARAAAYAQGGGVECADKFEFGGFKLVRHDIVNGATILHRTRTEYYQTGADSYLATQKGLPHYIRQIESGSSDTDIHIITSTYAAAPTGIADLYWIRKDQVSETTRGTPNVTHTTNYFYDQYGNQRGTWEYGLGPARIISTTYSYNTSAYILNRPSEQKVSDWGGGTNPIICRGRTQFGYDNQAYNAAPTLGNLTKAKVYITKASSDPTVCPDGISSESTMGYDDWGNPTQVTDALQHTTNLSYDTSDTTATWPRLFVYTVTQQTPVSTSAQLLTTYTWNKVAGQISSVTAPNTGVTNYQYDEYARLTQVTRPLESSFSQKFTYYNYYFDPDLPDRKPYMVKTEERTGTGILDIAYAYTFYDGLGREVQTIDPVFYTETSTTKYRITLTQFDKRGNVSIVYAPMEQASLPYEPVSGNPNWVPFFEDDPTTHWWTNVPKTTTNYDDIGRPTSVVALDGATTQYVHSVQNVYLPVYQNTFPLEQQKTIDANGNISNLYADAFGRVRLASELSGTTYFQTYYTYDVNDQLITVTHPAGNPTYISYDYAGRKTKLNDPDMGISLYTYDVVGNLTQTQDSRGEITCQYYDWQSRPLANKYLTSIDTSCTLPPNSMRPTFAGNVVHYYYDAQGSNQYGRGYRTKMLDGSGQTTWYYDQRGRVITETKQIEYSATTYTFLTRYEYDAMDRVSKVWYPKNTSGTLNPATDPGVVYSYNDPYQLQLRSMRYAESSTNVVEVDNFGYNLYGQLTQMDYETGNTDVRQEYEYWSLSTPRGQGRVRYVRAGLRDESEEGSQWEIQYFVYRSPFSYNDPGYDLIGNVTYIVDRTAGGTDPQYQNQRYTYDDLNRLSSAQVAGGPSGTMDIQYFSYDALGNLDQVKENAVSQTIIRDYAYSSTKARTLSYVDNLVSGQMVRTTYTHDAMGNMTNRGGQQLLYNSENRLVHVGPEANPLAPIASYTYDGDGNRVRSVTDEGVTFYIGNHTEYRPTTGKLTHYYYAGTKRVAMREHTVGQWGTVYYLLTDHLGSASHIVSTSGVELGEMRYTAWGQLRGGTSGTLPTERLYTGQIFDSETDLYFYNARYYDPILHRFIQPDTLIPDPLSPQSFNRYAYVRNNPIRYVDPSGNYECIVESTTYTGDCYADIDAWLSILETYGGEYGKALVEAFHLVDNNLSQSVFGEIRVGSDKAPQNNITIVVVDKFGDDAIAKADTSTNTIYVLAGALQGAADSPIESQYVNAGQFGHEIKHLDQGFWDSPSLRAEAEAYYVQSKVYEAFGLSDPNNGGAEAVGTAYEWGRLHFASNEQLMQSSLAANYDSANPPRLYKLRGLTDFMEFLAWLQGLD